MNQLLWYMTTTLALVLAHKVLYTNGSLECLKDNYIIVDKNRVKIECLPCHKCVIGQGLSPPCGTKLTESQKDDIKCNPCKPGETYSDDHGPSSCKSCQICPVTLKKCTTESNTKCSKDCDKGKYYDNSTYNCQPCSHCCRADNKIISECVVHGLPPQSQCSIHDSLECSPKTTKNPISSDKNSTDNKDSKDTIIVVVLVVLFLFLIVGVIGILHRWRSTRQRPGNTPEEGQYENRNLNTCGIKNSSFAIIGSPHQTGTIKEGEKIKLICKDRGSPEEDHCLGNYDYKWTKDMNDYHHNEQTLELNPVKVSDFGNYACQVRCRQHANKVPPVDAISFELDVHPGEGRRYKYFKEIESIKIHKKISTMLNPATSSGIGNWEIVAEEYHMEDWDIRALHDNGEKGKGVIEYLLSCQTKLTVYDFCKFLKTIKQNQIVDLLENHLTCTCDEERRLLDARDSGYGPESYGAQALPLSDETHARNNVALINSREASQDEIEVKLPANEKNNRKYQRQVSNQSAKSSGSGSGSATSSLLRSAQGIVRQISQNSSYKKHENENEVPV